MAGNSHERISPGDQAPSITLQDAKGGSHALKTLAASGPVVLAFFKISCPVCQYTMPFLERIKDGKVPIIGVSQDDAESTAEFQSEFSPNLTVLLDEYPYPASDGFRITHVPTLFQVEPDGRVSHAWEGFSRADLEQLGERTGLPVFLPEERVPAFRPG